MLKNFLLTFFQQSSIFCWLGQKSNVGGTYCLCLVSRSEAAPGMESLHYKRISLPEKADRHATETLSIRDSRKG